MNGRRVRCTFRIAPAVAAGLVALAVLAAAVPAQIAVRGRTVHTMAGPAIADGVVVVRDGKIAAVGPAATTPVPEGFRVLEAAVVTPGLIDAHSVVGLAGWLNQEQDQDQADPGAPIQPELRALDAYNPDDRLIEWVRGFGVTTLHTGHAPAQLVSGQTMIVKTAGRTVAEAVVVEAAGVAASLTGDARKDDKKAPGTRGKAVALLRAELVKAQEYLRRREQAPEDKRPARDLRLEALGRVLSRDLPLLITAQRSQDIQSALRLASEFGFRLQLDGAAEAYLLVDELKAAGVPVILHPPMARASGELENASFEAGAILRRAGIPFAFQSGYESYVPKTRIVLFEAAAARAHGLSFDEALASITSDAARILGIDARCGSLAAGKDGDVALYDGDPFEWTTHCTGTVIQGRIVHDRPR